MMSLTRAGDQQYFYLMGAVGGHERSLELFPIGDGTGTGPCESRHIRSEHGGEFCSFANDLFFKYGNNTGSLELTVTRIPERHREPN